MEGKPISAMVPDIDVPRYSNWAKWRAGQDIEAMNNSSSSNNNNNNNNHQQQQQKKRRTTRTTRTTRTRPAHASVIKSVSHHSLPNVLN